ncbi:DUF1579 domain-containing protein [uncultured Caulobacter sp.]|uniref:DUF1579 domain-containing protein n=1 Tax=uncultured Caulobacter sp. TaxID=158749 RepID=UPI002617778F|nr:DUF1579 domain-containing protein [uncultured Caulobacter sp.]
MNRSFLAVGVAAAVLTASAGAALAQVPADPAPRIAAQAEAMKKLSMMDGEWRGSAWTLTPVGRREVTQTERIGPLLGGAIKVLEGHGYNPDGSTGFNAFGVISFEPSTGAYSLHSYAMGQAGDFKLTPAADGYVWEIPAGPMTIRYTAVIKNGAWREIGERVVPGQAPMQFFEMNLKRLGDSAWPAAGAIPPK